MNILEEIAGKTRIRVAEQKETVSLEALRLKALSLVREEEILDKSFAAALRKPGMSAICEVKKASPSKGVIAEHFPYVEIAKSYETAGASAISVLTEPYYFQGDSRYLAEIKEAVAVPLLRKDFVVDSYQIYEAKCIGASAVLLICSILDEETLRCYIHIAESLKMDALVEAHDEKEVRMALKAGGSIIGVNNRDLKTFQVDVKNSLRLRKLVPSSVLFVSESGIRTREDIERLEEAGVDGVLIGETLMRSDSVKETLQGLLGKGQPGKIA